MSSRAGSTNKEHVKYVGCSTTWPLGVVCVGASDIVLRIKVHRELGLGGVATTSSKRGAIKISILVSL